MVGMVVGVGVAFGVVMALMGMVGTAMVQVLGDFQDSGANVYVAATGAELIPLEHASAFGTIDRAGALLSKLRSVPGVRGAVGVLSWSLQREREGREGRNRPTELIPTLAVDGDATEISNLVVMESGRWLRRGNEVVLGQSLSGSKELLVGDSLRMNGQTFEIVGIGRLRGFGPAGANTAYVDARALRQRGMVGDTLSYIAVQTSAPGTVRSVAEDFRNVRAVTPEEIVQETVTSQNYKGAMAFYWIMDGFILFVAGMFVSNMLARSVSERRTEFGTLRAIGVPGRTILLSVAAEGLVVVLLSYAFGFGVSLVLGGAINLWVARPLHYDHLFAVDPTMYLTIFAAALVLGLIAAFFPARAATKVDPLDVLRGV
jgi:putative ABC transport system permease protein